MAKLRQILVAGVKGMVKKAKAKTYGKKGANNLSDAFNNLNITSSSPPVQSPIRQALSSVSGNGARVGGPAKTDKGKAPTEVVAYDPQVEITALLCLESVENEVQLLNQLSETWAESLDVTKIAQGSYASILRMSLKDDPQTYTIWKLMPLENSKFWNKSLCVNATLIQDAATEMMALELMSDIPGFVQLRSATVVQGQPTDLLQEIFDEWDRDHPEDYERCDYGEDPLWLLAEMTDAGPDLETLLSKGFPDGTHLNKWSKGARLSLEQAWDIFFLTAQALAHGEQYARFEHRDLHPGNICIKHKDKESQKVTKDTQLIQQYTNIEITIIDYTLSRANLTEDKVLAHSMQDKAIFAQKSKNSNDQKQYDMYRWMRDTFEGTRHPKGDTSELWKAYIPMTNVLWLHHLLTILLQETEGFGKDGKGYMKKVEQNMASTLANLCTEMSPANLSKCDYLTATDVVHLQLAKEAKKVQGAMDDGTDYLGETDYMRALEARRSDRLWSAVSTS